MNEIKAFILILIVLSLLIVCYYIYKDPSKTNIIVGLLCLLLLIWVFFSFNEPKQPQKIEYKIEETYIHKYVEQEMDVNKTYISDRVELIE